MSCSGRIIQCLIDGGTTILRDVDEKCALLVKSLERVSIWVSLSNSMMFQKAMRSQCPKAPISQPMRQAQYSPLAPIPLHLKTTPRCTLNRPDSDDTFCWKSANALFHPMSSDNKIPPELSLGQTVLYSKSMHSYECSLS